MHFLNLLLERPRMLRIGPDRVLIAHCNWNEQVKRSESTHLIDQNPLPNVVSLKKYSDWCLFYGRRIATKLNGYK